LFPATRNINPRPRRDLSGQLNGKQNISLTLCFLSTVTRDGAACSPPLADQNSAFGFSQKNTDFVQCMAPAKIGHTQALFFILSWEDRTFCDNIKMNKKLK